MLPDKKVRNKQYLFTKLTTLSTSHHKNNYSLQTSGLLPIK